MHGQIDTAAPRISDRSAALEMAWNIVRAAADRAETLSRATEPVAFAISGNGAARAVACDDPDAVLAWQPGRGWRALLPPDDARFALVDLYLPICGANSTRPATIGHLGQSLDGFIATHSGESRWVTGHENILHLHRLRALCDAVVVGAETVAADDPLLTTRLVRGPNPLRVVIDPRRRLGSHHQVFTDTSADTLYVCGRGLTSVGERRFGCATVAGIEDTTDGLDIAALMQLLRARGCARVFVEGGGITVSMFLKAELLDRLHVAIAPLIIGDGRPAIRVPARPILDECRRPRYRVFRMGGDVLFDCELGTREDDSRAQPDDPSRLSRII